MHKFYIVPISAIALTTAISAGAQELSVVLKQPGAPLEISSYSASFQPESRGSSSSRINSDQINHSVRYTNTSTKEVVALQIGLTSFDAFNGFMGRFSGWATETLEPGATKAGEWVQRPHAAFAFKRYGTGVAYVNAVRFSDGTIWRANITEILADLQKFERELKREDLFDQKK